MEGKYVILVVLSIPLLLALFILCSGRNPVSIKLRMRNILVEVTSKKENIEEARDNSAVK